MSAHAKHILIVDDEEAVCWTLQRALTREGYSVDVAPSAEEAFAVVQKRRPAAVILDVRLPGWDGPQILTALQSINPELCCCFMTGNGGNYTERELLERGAARVFAKPVPLAELVPAIEQLVGSQAR